VEVNPDMRFLKQGKRSHLEFSVDSAEQIAESIDMTGLRGKIAQAFEAAIARARGSRRKSSAPTINRTGEVDPEKDAF